MKRYSTGRRLLAAVLILGLSATVHGAEKKDKSARRIQQMMQKMQQEKAEMQAQFDQEKAALDEKIKKSEQESEGLKSSLSAAGRKARALSSDLEALRSEKAGTEAKLQQSQAALEQVRATLENTRKDLANMTQQYQAAQHDIGDGEAQRKELTANLARKGQQVLACEEKNARLHDFGLELVKIYDHPQALRGEPFTQLKRVELENILQDYRDKLDEQRVTSLSGQER